MASTLQTMRSGGTQHPEEIINFINSRLVSTGGIFDISGTQFKVAEEDTPAMSVKVQEGYAFLPNSSGSMVYPVRLFDGDASVSISANSSGNDRIDAVVLYIDLSATANAIVSNVAKLVVVEGTPAGSPTAPSNGDIESEIGASNPYLRIADVEVGNGASSIVDADITDQRVEVTYIESIGGADWKAINGTVTRSSADDPTYVIKVASQDLTGVLSNGMRLKLTQNSIVRYAIITKVALNGSDTDITLLTRCDDYASSDADFDILDTGTYPITNIYYSSKYAPVGFELDADFWTMDKQLSSYTKASASDGTWYSSGQSLSIPIGSWNIRGHLQLGMTGSNNSDSVTGGLSEDATNPISNTFTGTAMPVNNTSTKNGRVTVEGRRVYTSKTTITALIKGNFYPTNLYLYSDTNNGYSTIKVTSTYI